MSDVTTSHNCNSKSRSIIAFSPRACSRSDREQVRGLNVSLNDYLTPRRRAGVNPVQHLLHHQSHLTTRFVRRAVPAPVHKMLLFLLPVTPVPHVPDVRIQHVRPNVMEDLAASPVGPAAFAEDLEVENVLFEVR